MTRKKIEDEDEDSLDFDDELPEEEEPNELNIESALVPRDYSDRKILVLEMDETHRQVTLDALQDILTGANIKGVSSIEEGIQVMSQDTWDTFVVDLQEPGVSVSNFVKKVNNLSEAILVAISYQTIVAGEVRNRVKLEPLRKLFDIEKPKPPKA